MVGGCHSCDDGEMTEEKPQTLPPAPILKPQKVSISKTNKVHPLIPSPRRTATSGTMRNEGLVFYIPDESWNFKYISLSDKGNSSQMTNIENSEPNIDLQTILAVATTQGNSSTTNSNLTHFIRNRLSL